MIRVLLIEDDPAVSDILTDDLESREEYSVIRAYDADGALSLSHTPFDVILLDVMLPDLDGVSLCAALRQRQKCPILFISCIDDEKIVIDALSQGGDDYIVKPFSNEMLHARIQANLRRVRMDLSPKPQNTLHCHSLSLDPDSMVLSLRGQQYKLGNIECRILTFFMEHPQECFTSAELYRKLWGKPTCGDTRTVLVHIHNLRKKLEPNPSVPTVLKSIPGRGYCFDSAALK